MNKYIDSEKLIGKIEKLKNELKSLMIKLFYAANYKEWEAELNGYNKILSIVSSLQQDQPEVDLDKELKNKKATLLDDAFGPMNGEQSLAIRNFARYFYELGKTARKEE